MSFGGGWGQGGSSMGGVQSSDFSQMLPGAGFTAQSMQQRSFMGQSKSQSGMGGMRWGLGGMSSGGMDSRGMSGGGMGRFDGTNGQMPGGRADQDDMHVLVGDDAMDIDAMLANMDSSAQRDSFVSSIQ